MGVRIDCCVESQVNLFDQDNFLLFLFNRSEVLKLFAMNVKTKEQFVFNTKLSVLASLQNSSQLQIHDKLYLCGVSDNPFDHDVSYLYSFKIDSLEDMEVNPQMLVNSIYPHEKPSVLLIDEDKILVVGGRTSVECEFYNLSTNRWRSVAKLPSLRYGCSMVEDPSQRKVLLVGGVDAVGMPKNSILAMDTQYYSTWEETKINFGPDLKCRFSGLFCGKSNEFVILGGSDDNSGKAVVGFNYKDREEVLEQIGGNLGEMIFAKPIELNNDELLFLNTNYQLVKVNKVSIEVEQSDSLID